MWLAGLWLVVTKTGLGTPPWVLSEITAVVSQKISRRSRSQLGVNIKPGAQSSQTARKSPVRSEG